MFRSPKPIVDPQIEVIPQNQPKVEASKRSTSRITTLWAAGIIIAVGVVTFGLSLKNNFVGDDSRQIVNNPVIQSLGNIPQLFNGSTAYSGEPDGNLVGAYYRPLMMTSYAIIYSVFNSSPVAFHVVQLILAILATFILFLFFRYTFTPFMALGLALIFLVHPIDSQSVLYIASLQEPLYFLFGITGVWLLLKFSSVRSLFLVASCLLLSMLAKEIGVLFVIMAALYLLMFNRRRFYPFLGIIIVPLIAYFALRTHALGAGLNPHLGPIDSLSLAARLITTPSIMLFYLTTFLFPYHLAHEYYWTYSTISLSHFVLPLLTGAVVVILTLYAGWLVKRKLATQYFLTYIFFAVWLVIGLAMHAQIIPLDLTASTAWFYFPIVGALGMLGIIAMVIPVRLSQQSAVALLCTLLLLLSIRTIVRGFDWNNDAKLAYHDIQVAKDDYNAEFEISRDLVTKGNYAEARLHAERAVALYPTSVNYEALGYITVFNGTFEQNRSALNAAVKAYPKDPTLWLYLAIVEYKDGDIDGAKASITEAHKLSPSEQIQGFYNSIMTNQPLNL